MIMIGSPSDGSSFPAGTTIPLQGTNGPPNRCVVTCGGTTINYTTGSGPGQLPIISMPGGAWSLTLTLPNATGDCVVFVFSESDKSAGVTYRLTAPTPGPTPGPTPPGPVQPGPAQPSPTQRA